MVLEKKGKEKEICEFCGKKVGFMSKVKSNYLDKIICHSCVAKGKLTIKCLKCGKDLVAETKGVTLKLIHQCFECINNDRVAHVNALYKGILADDAVIYGDIYEKAWQRMTELIHSGEKVSVALRGMVTNNLFATNLALIDKTERIPYEYITSITKKKKNIEYTISKTFRLLGTQKLFFTDVDSHEHVDTFIMTVRKLLANAQKEKALDSKPPEKYDIHDKIIKLGELKEKGLLTEEEFTQKKTELLKKL